ncbi:hypothetical protein TMatcc_007367 [Talaromyces marneffei ATCC 18224]
MDVWFGPGIHLGWKIQVAGENLLLAPGPAGYPTRSAAHHGKGIRLDEFLWHYKKSPEDKGEHTRIEEVFEQACREKGVEWMLEEMK